MKKKLKGVQLVYKFGFIILYLENEAFCLNQPFLDAFKRVNLTKINLFLVQELMLEHIL